MKAMRSVLLFVLFVSSCVYGSEEQWLPVNQFSLIESTADSEYVTATIATTTEKFVLRLKPAVFGNDTEWLKSNGSNLQFYEGHVAGEPLAWARIAVNGSYLYGMVKHKGVYLTLSNYSEPFPSFAGKDLRNSLTDRSALAYDSLGEVAGPDADGESFNQVLRIGVVVDHYYDAQYGGQGVAHALSVVNATDGIMRENLQLALKVDAVVQTIDEDFSNAEGASSEQLSRFRTFRQSVPELSPDLGLVHLFSHAPRFGNVIGRAYVSTVCSTTGLDVGISLGYPLSSQLMAHELGHNLGSRHDTVNGCENGPRRIMYPSINDSREFSSCSIDSMRAVMEWRDCYLAVVELAVNALLLERTMVVQVSNNNPNEQVTDITLVIDRTNNLADGMPANCALSGSQIICSIPLLAADETVDIQFPINGNATGNVEVSVNTDNSFEHDLSDNTSSLDLSGLPEVDPEGLCIDTDGDGFGWNGEGSCRTLVVPLDTTEVKPEYTNVQTGIPVNLVQAFWKPQEFIGQVVECVPHHWSSDNRYYKAYNSIVRRYQHELADGEDSRGTVQVATYVAVSEENDAPGTSVEEFDWSVDSGRYFGPAPLARSSYIQIVDEANTRFNAVRSWTSNISFDLCRSFPDPDGYFVPSGTVAIPVAGVCIDTPPRNDGFGWDGIETCLVDPDLDVTGSRSVIVNSIDAPIQIDGVLDDAVWQNASHTDTSGNDLKTGVTVFGLDPLRSASWAIAHDNAYLYIAVTVPDNTPVNDSDVLYQDDSIELFFDGGYQRNTRYDSDDTQVILRNNGERAGITDRNINVDYVRLYDAEQEQYVYEVRLEKSSLSLGAGEFGFELHVNDDQDGDLRENKFGWASQEGADTQWYDMSVIGHACLEGGGASQNCLLSTISQCIDTDGDGWGWDGTGSCRVACIDTDPVGDGWGWDGTESCRIVAPPPRCIDTDPVGDGWGWDGTESCKIECIDTDPIGDGWGWDGTGSCRVGSPGVCVDTDPVGDGWGWDGVGSCRI